MSHSPNYPSLKSHALRIALDKIDGSDQDEPPSIGHRYFYERYPYSRASHDPETEWGTHYQSLEWELPEGNNWKLSMMDSWLDGSKVSQYTVTELESLPQHLDEEPRFRVIEFPDGLDQLEETPDKMPKPVMQLLFTRYDVSPKFLDLIAEASKGSIMGVSQLELKMKGSQTPDIMFNLCYPALSSLPNPGIELADNGVALQEIGIYIHSFDTSVTVFLAQRSSSPLMSRIKECLESGSRSHLQAFFLVPLVSLSYAVHQWRKILAIVLSAIPKAKFKFAGEELKNEFDKLQDFAESFCDIANFFGTLESLIEDFEKLSKSLNTDAAVKDSEIPAQSPDTGDTPSSRTTGKGLQAIQQGFMNLRREAADQHKQLRTIEQILKRSSDAFNHAREASNSKQLEDLLDSEQRSLKTIEQLQRSTLRNGETSTEIMNTNTKILDHSQKGGQTMLIIAVISALYAPGAYFSSLFGPDIIMVAGTWIGVGPKFWVYFPITILFTLVTIIILWKPGFLALLQGRGKSKKDVEN